MNKKSLLTTVALVTLVISTKAYSQGAKPSASPDKKPAAAAPLTVDKAIEQVQARIIMQQGEILKSIQVVTVAQNILKDISSLALDSTTGKVKNQNMVDLLSKNGVTISSGGKPLNEAKAVPTPPAAEDKPFDITMPADATPDEKTQLSALIAQTKALDEPVKKAKAAQFALQELAISLIDTAKTDEDAQKLIKKYDIKQNAPTP